MSWLWRWLCRKFRELTDRWYAWLMPVPKSVEWRKRHYYASEGEDNYITQWESAWDRETN